MAKLQVCHEPQARLGSKGLAVIVPEHLSMVLVEDDVLMACSTHLADREEGLIHRYLARSQHGGSLTDNIHLEQWLSARGDADWARDVRFAL